MRCKKLFASKKQHINMIEMRRKIGIMSVNQMCIYHTLLETFNIMKNSSSEQIKMKWCNEYERNYLLRSTTRHDLNVPEKPLIKCTGI